MTANLKCGAGVVRSIDITFDKPLYLIVILCDVTALNENNGPTTCGRRLHCSSSPILPAFDFRDGGGSKHTLPPQQRVSNRVPTDESKF